MASTTADAADIVVERKRHSMLVDLLIRLVKEKPLGTAGGIIVLMLFLTGIFAEFIAPYGYNEIIIFDRLSAPSAAHILGADNMGRDLLSRIIFGARISMIVGLAGSLLFVLVGSFIGIPSGFFGGKYDTLVQRFVDAFMCFPPLILYLTIMAVLGPGLWQVIMVLGISDGIRGSRTVRSAVIGIKENVYMDAARAIGASSDRIILKHILPNIMPVVIVARNRSSASLWAESCPRISFTRHSRYRFARFKYARRKWFGSTQIFTT